MTFPELFQKCRRIFLNLLLGSGEDCSQIALQLEVVRHNPTRLLLAGLLQTRSTAQTPRLLNLICPPSTSLS